MSGILLLVLYFFWSGQDLSKCCILLTLELTVKEKRRKLILHKNLFKVFIFLTRPKLEAFFSQNKGSSRKINLLCEENHKVAPIINIAITFGRLGLYFRGNCDDQSIIQKQGSIQMVRLVALLSICSSG